MTFKKRKPRKWSTSWKVTPDLQLVSTGKGKEKIVELYGRASTPMKARLKSLGFSYDPRVRRWTKKMPRTRKLPSWLGRKD